MANYIGNTPANGEFKHLDSIASQFNGSSVTFALQFNSVSQSVGDATQLIVSLNGIIQEPLTAYTLGTGGSNITFASAPASGDTCFIVMLGGVGGTVTPSDNSVTAAKIASGAVTSSKISIDGDISFPDNDKAVFGSELEIYSDGSSNSIIKGSGTTYLRGSSVNIGSNGGSGGYPNTILVTGNTSTSHVEMLYGLNKKFETTSTGVTVTGTVAATAYTGDGSALTGISFTETDTLDSVTGRGATTTNDISVNTLTSTVASGTAPLTVTSDTVVTNLNADKLDGKQYDEIIAEATALAIALG